MKVRVLKKIARDRKLRTFFQCPSLTLSLALRLLLCAFLARRSLTHKPSLNLTDSIRADFNPGLKTSNYTNILVPRLIYWEIWIAYEWILYLQTGRAERVAAFKNARNGGVDVVADLEKFPRINSNLERSPFCKEKLSIQAKCFDFWTPTGQQRILESMTMLSHPSTCLTGYCNRISLRVCFFKLIRLPQSSATIIFQHYFASKW